MTLEIKHVALIVCIAIGFLTAHQKIFSSQNDSSLVISLKKMNIRRDKITISGFSAGGSMATQMHVAHSSLFHGVAIFGQVFYRCGPKSKINFGIRCSKIGKEFFPYDVQYSIQDAEQYAIEGKIDSLEHIRNDKVFVWIGTLDEYIPLELAKQNRDFYSHFLENPETQINVEEFHASHLFPTVDYGVDCDKDATETEYLGRCNYSGAYNALNFLLDFNLQAPSRDDAASSSRLFRFDQSAFYEDGPIVNAAMGTMGHIYIPENCLSLDNEPCFLHFNFHGCNEWPLDLAERYALNSGFLEVAEKNNIIVVFPLTTAVPENMNGCWDFFSYTGEEFATRDGIQIKIIYKMIQRLIGK